MKMKFNKFFLGLMILMIFSNLTYAQRTDFTLPTPKKTKIGGDIKSGTVQVDIAENINAVIRIGLAERGVAILDFPKDDPVFKIHPGDENYVTVGCDGRNASGKCGNSPQESIVLRPGRSFNALTKREAATVISVQRVSGLVITFIVVPVSRISENANYVAIKYDVKKVLKAREQAGLVTNLHKLSPNYVEKIKEDSSKPKLEKPNIALKELPKGEVSDIELENKAEELLKQFVKQEIPAFSKPTKGLSVARLTNEAIYYKNYVFEVVALRNMMPHTIHLVPEQPSLDIFESKKFKDKVNLDIKYLVTTLKESEVIEAGQVHYYAIAYKKPILQAKQNLYVSFAHREAADVPVKLALSRK